MKSHWEEEWREPTSPCRVVDSEGRLHYANSEEVFLTGFIWSCPAGWIRPHNYGYDTGDWKNSKQTFMQYKDLISQPDQPVINLPIGWKSRRTERRNKNGDIVEIEVYAWKDIGDQAQIEEYKRLGMLV